MLTWESSLVWHSMRRKHMIYLSNNSERKTPDHGIPKIGWIHSKCENYRWDISLKFVTTMLLGGSFYPLTLFFFCSCFFGLYLFCSWLWMLLWQMTAQKQKGQTLNAASTQKAIDILKVCRVHLRANIILMVLTPSIDTPFVGYIKD